MNLIFLVFLPIFQTKNYYQQSLGILAKEKQQIYFAKGTKNVFWQLHYASPCSNITTAQVFDLSTCGMKESKFNEKSEKLIKSCHANFDKHLDMLKNVLPVFQSQLPSRTRRQAILLPALAVFSIFCLTIRNRIRLYQTNSNFANFVKWNDRKISDISKTLVNVETLSQRNFKHTHDFMNSVCTSLIHSNDEIIYNSLNAIFNRFYDQLMSDILLFSDNEVPKRTKFFFDLLEICIKLQNQDISLKKRNHICNKIIRSPEFLVNFVGIQIINGTSPSLVVNLNLSIPVISEKFLSYTSFELYNVGYFRNTTFFKLTLPQRFIKFKNEIISLDNNCGHNLCHIRNMRFDNQALCISSILSNSSLSYCVSSTIKNPECIVQNLDQGLLISAPNGIIVFKNHAAKVIKYSSNLIFGDGTFVCQISQNKSLTYIFNSKANNLSTSVYLNKLPDSHFSRINVTISELENVEVSQELFNSSHFKIGPYLTIGTDLILFCLIIIIIVVFTLIYRSRKRIFPDSFANMLSHFGAKWCRKGLNSNTNAIRCNNQTDTVIISTAVPSDIH